MRWLTGFIVFGIVYALLVLAIFVKNWPSLEQPRLYGTLEQQLSTASQSAVISIKKNPQAGTQGERYIVKQYPLGDGSTAREVIVANGDTIVLDQNVSDEAVNKIAQEYVDLLQRRVDALGDELKVQMFFVILIPIVLLILFAFFSRWIWNRIPKIR